MTEAAQRYRGLHRLLGQAKRAGWRITCLSATGHWRLHSPCGSTLTVSLWPTMRGLMDAEQGFDRIQRTNAEVS